jgi:hypothetical protein
MSGGDPHLAGRTTTECPALRQQAGAGSAMDGTIDATPAEQRGVGGVDDRIDVQPGDVALDDSDPITRHGSTSTTS